ncbi:MAG: transporter substrate-binding domain-containing protein [Pseudorhodoplanes sp.]
MRSRRTLLVLVAALIASTAVQLPCFAQDQAAQILAPGGKLRVGVYLGSPTSMVRQGGSGEAHGIAYDLGRELAKRLGVAFEPVIHRRVAEVLDAMKSGNVDFTVTNATPARAQDVDFSQPLFSLELGYLVPAGSVMLTAADVDKPGRRIGVSQGSTSERTLPKMLTQAVIVPAPSLKDAVQMLNDGRLDAFATNKSILFEMSDDMPGAKVLDGRWGVEHMAAAVPKGREGAHDDVRKFVAEIQKIGLLSQAIKQSGLRGFVPPE